MMEEIVIILREAEKEALATVRCFPGLDAATAGGMVWVRGIAMTDADNLALCSLPVLQTYFLDADNLLFPAGALTPVMKLPALQWVQLPQFIPVTLPVSPLPAKSSDTFAVRLKHAGHEAAPFALRTSLHLFQNWVNTAAEVRISKLQFAVSENNEVLITGNPLPALPGAMYWKTHDLLLPGGYQFDPPILASLVQARWNETGEAWLLFHANGNYEVIPKIVFVPASRSAVRLSPVIPIGHG